MAAPRSNTENIYVHCSPERKFKDGNCFQNDYVEERNVVKLDSEHSSSDLESPAHAKPVTNKVQVKVTVPPDKPVFPQLGTGPLIPSLKDLPPGTSLSQPALSTTRSLTKALQEEYRNACLRRLVKDFCIVKPPITVEEYIRSDRFDGGRFGALPFARRVDGCYPNSVQIKGRTIDTRWGAWTNRWRHWTKIPAALNAPQDCDMAWFRHPSEADYFARVKADIKRIINGDLVFEHVSDLTCHLPRPLTSCYFYAETAIWARDMSTEFRLRRHSDNFSGIQRARPSQPLFVGWHNIEIFHMVLSRRTSWYVPVWEEFYRHWEASPVIIPPSPWAPMLFGQLMMNSDSRVRAYLRANTFLEFVYISFARFLHTAQYGVGFNQLGDPGLKNSQYGVLAPVPCFHQIVIDNHGVLNILKGSSIDHARALLAWERSREIDWSIFPRVMGKTGPYLYYNWVSGEVHPVPERFVKFPLPNLEVDSESPQSNQVKKITLPEMRVAWHRVPCTLQSCQNIVEQYWSPSDEPIVSNARSDRCDEITPNGPEINRESKRDTFETRALTTANEACRAYGIAPVSDGEYLISQIPVWIKAFRDQEARATRDRGRARYLENYEYEARKTERRNMSSHFTRYRGARSGYASDSSGGDYPEVKEEPRLNCRRRATVRYDYDSRNDSRYYNSDYDDAPPRRRPRLVDYDEDPPRRRPRIVHTID